MVPGASTNKEEEYFIAKVSTECGTPAVLDFFDFFTVLVVTFVVLRGVKTFSALVFNPPGSFPLFTAGGLGDFSLGEIGGDSAEGSLVLVPAALQAGCINGTGGPAGSRVGDFGGEFFLSELCLSKLGT
jgi:inactivated superfamily I helicase